MFPSGFLPSSAMSLPYSHATNTSIHLLYVGSSRKHKGYFWVVVEALLPKKGLRYSFIRSWHT